MNKTVKICIAAIALLLAAGVGASAYIYTHKSEGSSAYIYQDGTLIQTIDLSKVKAPYTFDVTNSAGETNTIEVRPGEIGIIKASCPDKVCVHMGFIKNDMLPITCLPNKLVIKIQSGEPDKDKLDGISR